LPEISPIYQAAITAAIEAAKAIMKVYGNEFQEVYKQDGSPVTEADHAASACIETILAPLGIPITGEETEKAPFSERQHWPLSWCIDPLDGTKEFIKRNGEFAVNIALIEKGIPVFGLIASPVQETILLGSKETGVYLFHFNEYHSQEKWMKLSPPSNTNNPMIMACSRSHHSGPVLQFINELKEAGHNLDFIRKGSALKFFDLALGKADVYPRFAPTMEWDIAAGQAILEALGGEVVHAETGEPLHYNKANLLNPFFIARTVAVKSLLS
jgi:3'(2'), 5'-bisphosphate nucleotidase